MADPIDAPAQPPGEPPATSDPIDAARADLVRWRDIHCRDSALSRDTDTYNRVTRAVGEILQALATARTRKG